MITSNNAKSSKLQVHDKQIKCLTTWLEQTEQIPDDHFDWVHSLGQALLGWNGELELAVFVSDLGPHVLPFPSLLVHHMDVHLPWRALNQFTDQGLYHHNNHLSESYSPLRHTFSKTIIPILYTRLGLICCLWFYIHVGISFTLICVHILMLSHPLTNEM